MLKCLIALTSLFTAAALAVPVWTWVDEEGGRHYSDRPVEGATRIEIGDGQTFSVPRPPPPLPPAVPGNPSPPAAPYSTLAVLSPESQETLHNIGGTLTVDLTVVPGLQSGHRIDVALDGRHVAIGARGSSLTVPEVWRGEHTLQAVIVGADGEEIMRSPPVTFFVRQTSVLNPPPRRAPAQ